MKLSVILIAGITVLAGCDTIRTNSNHEVSLPISNSGFCWDHQFSWDVIITGDEERKIMQMDIPPRDQLLECLNDKDKYEIAHVLLSLRYLKISSSGSGDWNGLEMGSKSKGVPAEMKSIQDFWHEKMEKGDLDKPNPVLAKGFLDRTFGISKPEPQAVIDAKTLDFYKNKNSN